MDQYKERSRKAFNAQAATYDRTDSGAHARRLYPHVLAALAGAREGDLLDVGCGTGALARLVLEQGPMCRVTGLDLAPAMVEQARANLGGFGARMHVVEGDSDRLPFHEESFDAATVTTRSTTTRIPKRRRSRCGACCAQAVCSWWGIARCPRRRGAIMNAFMRFSSEGDVRIYSKGEYERMLGRWFSSVTWRRVEGAACIVEARK